MFSLSLRMLPEPKSHILIDPLAAYLQKRVNLRHLSLVAILVETAALVGASFCTSYWQFLICYGVLANSSAVLLMMASLLSAWEWFPDVRGQVTGAILACQAFSRGMWACIGLLFLNPGEQKMIDVDGTGKMFYPLIVGQRVPFFCYVLAGYVFIAGMSGSLLLKRNSIQKLKDKVSFRRTHNSEKARRHSMDAFLTDVGGGPKDYISVRDAVRTK